jgi:hypothetical protein
VRSAVALDCQDTIALAINALPYNHPRLLKVSLQYGTYCAYSGGCPMSGPANRVDLGYVTFQYEPPAPADAVYVVMGDDGHPALAGCIDPWPPEFFAEPTPIPSDFLCSHSPAR